MAYPLPKKPDLYDFLVEFYDVNNNIAETFTIRQNVEFTGAPLNIDGSAVTENWIGGCSPSDGGSSGVDIYTYNIIKTASATFTVIANQTKTS